MTRTSTEAVRSVFIDTGGWYSVTSREDRYHEAGSRYYRSLLVERARLFTSDYVLDETLTRLRYDFGLKTAITFWERLEAALANGELSLMRVDESVWAEAMSVFRSYEDQKFSFTDCTSFVLARDYRVTEVFAFDHHFRIFGLVVRPEIP